MLISTERISRGFPATLRTLGRHRGFATVAILSIAIAIALNTVMYSVLDAMLMPRINARQPSHIYSIQYYGNGIWSRRVDPRVFTDALAAGFGENGDGFTGTTTFRMRIYQSPIVESGSRYKRVRPVAVRANYFDFLGSLPREGRTFRESDELEENPVAIISDRLAKHLFPDQSAVGQMVTLDGSGYSVIGVVEHSQAFSLLSPDFYALRQPSAPAVTPNLIRLKEPIEDKLLADQLKVTASRIAMTFNEPTAWVAFTGKRIFKGQMPVGRFHWALIGAVAAVLLVACANLANLQLARGLARSRELALRAAVGASRRQLIRLLVIESGILAIAGLVLGITLTIWGVHIVEATIPESVAEFIIRPQTSWRMFAFASSAAIACLFLIGLLPALRISKVDPNEMLKSGAGTGANREHRRRYGLMVVAQIGFALPVLIAAVVVLRGAWTLSSPEWVWRLYGFDARPIIASTVLYPPAKGGVLRVGSAAGALVASTLSVPGITHAAAFVRGFPIGNKVTVDDETGVVREEMAHLWNYRKVTPDYFRTLGQAIHRGRDFNEGDWDGVGVIMDGGSARFLWGAANPIGRSIKFGDAKSNAPWHRVIGIVHEPRDSNTMSQLDYTTGYRLGGAFRLMTPSDSQVAARRLLPAISLFARARGNAELAAIRVQRQLRGLQDADPPSVTPLTDEFRLTTMRTGQEFVASLFSTFALIGLALVAIGVYGIVSHSVVERRRELAVRISVGATPKDILRAVLREGNVLILTGIAIGLLFTKYTIFWLSQFISGGDGYHAVLFAFIAAGLFGLAAFAAFIPALRATRIDPVEALRHE